MGGIVSYTNTRKELKIAEHRLSVLINRKDELYHRFCMPKGWQISDGASATHAVRSGTELYVTACNTRNEATGLSLNEEIDKCQREVEELRDACRIMEDALERLDGIEATLYCMIIINGKKPTEAVNELAEMEHYSVDNIWHTYYRKIKPYIDALLR